MILIQNYTMTKRGKRRNQKFIGGKIHLMIVMNYMTLCLSTKGAKGEIKVSLETTCFQHVL